MKTPKFLKTIIALIALFASTLPAMAHDFEVDGIYYMITSKSDKTVAVTYKGDSFDSFNEYYGEVEIPDRVTYSGISYNVTSISGGAFLDCMGLTSVTIGNSVTKIGLNAFGRCTGLTSVTIPNSVTMVSSRAFCDCTSLEEVHITDLVAWCNIYFDGDLANPLRNETNLYLNEKIITDLVIPDIITEIKQFTFAGWKGLSVTIGNSVTSIGEGAFMACKKLTSVTIPNSVTTIGGCAFIYCSGLISITIPTSVTKIGGCAFNNCINLKYVYYDAKNLRGAVSNIFYSYDNRIIHIVIGAEVESIPKGIFNDCDRVGALVSKNPTPPVCDAEAFGSIDKSRCVLYVPEASYIDYWNADVWKDFASIKPLTETKSLSFTDESIAIKTNEDLQLNAVITPDDATFKNLIWTSSNPEIATVSGTGVVHGVVPGETIITAMAVDGTNLKASCKVTVESVRAESITLNHEIVQLQPYESIVLDYTILPYNTTDKSVTWTSSDPSVVTLKVNNDGSATVLMLKKGTVTITAVTNDGSNLSASCIVSDEVKAKSITLSQTEALLAPDESISLSYSILPENTTNKSVTWTSSDPSVANFNVNNDGSATVMKLKEGTAIITVTTNDGSKLSASCVISNAAGVEGIETDDCKVSVENGAIVVKNATGIVTVHNLMGVTVASAQADGSVLRIGGLQPGVYIVTVNGKATKVVL